MTIEGLRLLTRRKNVPNLYTIRGSRAQTSICASQEPILCKTQYNVIEQINKLHENKIV